MPNRHERRRLAALALALVKHSANCPKSAKPQAKANHWRYITPSVGLTSAKINFKPKAIKVKSIKVKGIYASLLKAEAQRFALKLDTIHQSY